MARGHNYNWAWGKNGRRAGTVTVHLSNYPHQVRAATLNRCFPNIGFYMEVTQEVFLEDIDDEAQSSVSELVLGVLVSYVQQLDQGILSSTIIDALEDYWTQHELSMSSSRYETTLFAEFVGSLGRLLSTECLGHSMEIFDQIASFFTSYCDILATSDEQAFLATLGAICELAGSDMTKLTRSARCTQQNPEALSVVKDYFAGNMFSDPYYISDEMLMALNMTRPTRRLPPQFQKAWPSRKKRYANQMMPGASFPQPPGWGSVLGPSYQSSSRPRLGPRAKSVPSVRGSSLPVGILQQVVLHYPQAVQIDGRVLMGTLSPILPWQGAPQKLIMPVFP